MRLTSGETRSRAVALVLAVLGLGGGSSCVAAPNILMFAVDDLRPMLGCYGDERVKTPNIDRLAQSGMLFERAYCNYAKCGPSRLSLMTGLRPASIGVFNHRDGEATEFRERRPDAVPLSRWFRDSGYEVRSFGKIDHDGWDVPDDWSEKPFPGRDGEMLEIAGKNPPEVPSRIAERTACPVMQSPDVEDDYFFAGRMASRVSELLASKKGEKPFFYAVGFRRPHLPFVAPKRYFDLYQPDESWLTPYPEPPEGAPWFTWFNSDGYTGMAKRLGDPMPEKMTRDAAISFNGFEMRSYLGVPYRGALNPDMQMDLLHAYAACVSYVDAQIGRILESLEKSGKREETIIVLWSDHGWHLGELSAWGKMTNYEVANRVPLILSAPGFPNGKTESIVELVDLYPTLCELANLKKPAHLEGESFFRVLENPESEAGEAAFHEYVRFNGRYHGRAVRTPRYRYIRWRNRKGELVAEELYDLAEDPGETRNLAPLREDLVKEMGRKLAAAN